MRCETGRGRWFGAVVVTALLVLGTACARPVGTLAHPSTLPSITPVAGAHAPLRITEAAFHVGEVGVTYTPAVKLGVSGGVAPYRWTIAFGALPDGLTLAGDTVSGTATAAGTFSFGVQVFDSDSDTAGVPVSIGIVARLTASLVPGCATECTVELGCVTVCGAFGQASGGLPPLVYTRTSGALPSGTTLSNLTLDGTFTGLPGRLQFTVQVTDGFGVTTSLSPTFNLLPHISFGGSANCGPVFYKIGCSTQLPYSLGTPNSTPTVNVTGVSATYCAYNAQGILTCTGTTNVPTGFSAVPSGGTVTMTVPPSTAPYHTYKGTITLQLVDSSLCGPGTYCVSGSATLNVDLNGG